MPQFPRSSLGPEHQRLYDRLIELGQSHLFCEWRPDADPSSWARFFSQVEQLSASYPGGLENYLANVQSLLQAAEQGKTAHRDCRLGVPPCFQLDVQQRPEEFHAAELTGLARIGESAFVIVAGGVGDRLGCGGPKILLPMEVTTGKTFLQYFIEFILALQARARAQCGDERLALPLLLMTSAATTAPIQRFLVKNAFFGMPREQITLVEQDQVPCVTDPQAHLANVPGDPYQLLTKPHGHGDVHGLLHKTGLARAWRDSGKRWLIFFQDTNALACHAFLPALGISSRERLDMNFVAVPRIPGEKIGSVARLFREGQPPLSVNVEYNELDRMLAAAGHPQGDVADASGFSPYPGSVNILLFSLATYCETLERTRGRVPEFINPKYHHDDPTKFASPARLECLMQDLAKLFHKDERVGVTQLNRWLIFSPVKNSLAAAQRLAADGLPPESAASSEMDFYRATARLLDGWNGNALAADEPRELGGLSLPVGPRIIVAPALATAVFELRARIRGLKMSRHSTLVIDGDDVEIDGLELDGTLVITAVPGARVQLKNLRVHNQGWPIEPLSPGASGAAEDAIRGYRISRDPQRACLCEFPRPGVFTPERLPPQV